MAVLQIKEAQFEEEVEKVCVVYKRKGNTYGLLEPDL